jgi:HAE1 family hydrophobic/amphiphilic exporter-1
MVIAEFNLDTSSAIGHDWARRGVIALHNRCINFITELRCDGCNFVTNILFESNSMSLAQLSSYVDKKIVPQLKTVSGVGNVNLLGDAKRQIRSFFVVRSLQALQYFHFLRC